MAASGYYPDLSTFSLTRLKSRLKTGRLLPSQQILLEKIDERFAAIEQHGIDNLEQLEKALKSKSGVLAFEKATGLPADYLTILRREVNSYLPKPVDLRDFPGVKSEVAGKLLRSGIKNTEQLFPLVLTPAARSELAKQSQIEYADILELTKLTDVARLKWVGPKFARLLLESGYDTVEKVAGSNADELYHALVRSSEKSQYKGMLGIEDIRSWVGTVVQDVPRVVRY